MLALRVFALAIILFASSAAQQDDLNECQKCGRRHWMAASTRHWSSVARGPFIPFGSGYRTLFGLDFDADGDVDLQDWSAAMHFIQGHGGPRPLTDSQAHDNRASFPFSTAEVFPGERREGPPPKIFGNSNTEQKCGWSAPFPNGELPAIPLLFCELERPTSLCGWRFVLVMSEDSCTGLGRIVREQGLSIPRDDLAAGWAPWSVDFPAGKIIFGDVDRSGHVDVADVLCVLDSFRQTAISNPAADLAPWPAGDGLVDLADIMAAIDSFALQR